MLVTRRNALKAGSALAGAAFLGFDSSSQAQSSPSSQAATYPALSSSLLHPSLHRFVIDSISRTLGKHAAGSSTREDWQNTAAVMKMHANHLYIHGVDRISEPVSQVIDPTKTDASQTQGFDLAYRLLKTHNPGLDRGALAASVSRTHDQIVSTQKSVLANGISWHFYQAAEMLHFYSKAETPARSSRLTFSSPNASAPHLVDGTYHPKQRAVLKQVGLGGYCKKQACNMLLNEPGWTGAFEGELSFILGGVGAIAGCLAMAGGSILLTALTDGAAIGAVGAAALGCEVLTDSAGIVAATGIAYSAAVAKAVDAWQKKNCGH